MNALGPIVYVVDDDHGIRESLSALLNSYDLHAVAFCCASDYLAFPKPEVPSCLVLDLELPDIDGLELQRLIGQEGRPPVVFISGHGNVSTSVEAMKAGAVDFLAKPFRAEDLMRAVHAAIELDRAARRRRTDLAELNRRLSSLTPREREVFPLIASGLMNKQAAAQLGISETTIQIHRGQIMKKMQARSLAELVRIAGTLDIPMNHARPDRE